MDYIKTNITLWHITILFNSGDMNENKMPITKAFKDTIQKVTNVSPRQTVLLPVWIMNPKTKQTFADLNMNIKKSWQTSLHLIFKADEIMATVFIHLK